MNTSYSTELSTINKIIKPENVLILIERSGTEKYMYKLQHKKPRNCVQHANQDDLKLTLNDMIIPHPSFVTGII